jgi:cytoskeletal protein RodZ
MASLGEKLKFARRSIDKSLEDAARDTNISKHYLEAFEEDKYDAFPSPVYARGFLSTYARYVELDPKAVVKQYDKLTGFSGFSAEGILRSMMRRSGQRQIIGERVIMLAAVILLIIACLVAIFLKKF